MLRKSKMMAIATGLGCFLLSACAETPDNPSVDVMPPPGMSWETFSGQREFCKSQARDRVRHTVHRANERGIIGGVAATALGAGLGAAAGGAGGAAIGAGAGALAGTAGGGMYSASGNGSIQMAYNIAYLQCMGTNGAIVPGHPANISRPYGSPVGYPGGYPGAYPQGGYGYPQPGYGMQSPYGGAPAGYGGGYGQGGW